MGRWVEEVSGIGGDGADEFFNGEVEGLGNEVGDVADGNGSVVGLDEQAVERGDLQGGGVETSAEGEVATRIEPCACHMGIAAHAVDGKLHIGQASTPTGIKHLSRRPHAVHHDGLSQVMRQLEMTHKQRFLQCHIAATQSVQPRLADSEHLGVTGTLLQQVKIGIGDTMGSVPRMKTDRIPQTGLRVKPSRVHRDESSGGVKPMGMEVENIHF